MCAVVFLFYGVKAAGALYRARVGSYPGGCWCKRRE